MEYPTLQRQNNVSCMKITQRKLTRRFNNQFRTFQVNKCSNWKNV